MSGPPLVARARHLVYVAAEAVARRFPTTFGDLLDRRLHGFTAADRPAPPPVPDAPVRLFVGPTNYAGQGTAFARAVEAHDPRVGAVTMAPQSSGGFAYPVDQPVPLAVYDGSRLWHQAQRDYLRSFTHVLVESGRPLFSPFNPSVTGPEAQELLAAGLRVALLFHGSDIRLPSRHLSSTPWSPFTDPDLPPTPGYEIAAAAHRVVADTLHAQGIPVFVTTPDLLLDVPYAQWCPVVVDPELWQTPTQPLVRDVPVVLHAPSKALVKGTALVEPQLVALAEEGLIDYRRVEGVPWEDMPALVQEADVVVDQFRIGNYGVAACEAMAAGRLVLSHVTDQVRDHVKAATGQDLPVLETPADELSERLREVLADRVGAQALAAQGPAFVRAVHDGRRAGEVLSGFVQPDAPVPEEHAEAHVVTAGTFDARSATGPSVDLVVAVHDLSRPVGRAVGSALATAAGWDSSGEPGGPDGRVRVTVACHELSAADVAEVLPPELGPYVRLLEVRDGLGSPSGPFNAGIDLADAPYVSIMGSDDILEPGALLAWHDRAEATGADVVLARMRMQSGAPVNTPRVRPGRSADLDPVADRLAYRTAPIGLLRRSTLDRHRLRLDPGMKNGGDLAFTVRLWSLVDRVELAATAPAYVIGLDARTRVTTTVRPLADELFSHASLLTRPWFAALPEAYRRAVAVKVLRIHVLGAVTRRSTPQAWADGETGFLRDLVRGYVRSARGVLRPFSLADRLVLDACLDPRTTPESLTAAAAARASSGRWKLYATRPLTAVLDRESTLRSTLADLVWRVRG